MYWPVSTRIPREAHPLAREWANGRNFCNRPSNTRGAGSNVHFHRVGILGEIAARIAHGLDWRDVAVYDHATDEPDLRVNCISIDGKIGWPVVKKTAAQGIGFNWLYVRGELSPTENVVIWDRGGRWGYSLVMDDKEPPPMPREGTEHENYALVVPWDVEFLDRVPVK